MKVKYLGHSCFQITGNNGITIVTDPFDNTVGYKALDVSADIVTMSHNHFDHNYSEGIKGDFKALNKVGIFYVKDVNITGIASYHDNVKGVKRGSNVIYTYEIDGIKLCHLGDLGYIPDTKQLEEIGGVDVLFIPVGGYYTIDANDAVEIVNLLKPSIVFPMHYKTPVVDFPIESVDAFLKKVGGGEKLSLSEIEINRDDLHGQKRVCVLQYE